MRKLRYMLKALLIEFTPKGTFNIFKRRRTLFLWLIVRIFILSFLISLGRYSITNVEYLKVFIISTVLQLSIITVIQSDKFEGILRRLEDARRIATKTEHERLRPIFKEVYKKVKQKYGLKHKVRLYIVDHIAINAFTIGRHTIVINRGLMEAMTDDEIKGIIAHEFAHIVNGDATVQLLLTFATTFYLWIVLFIRFIFKTLENLTVKYFISCAFSFICFVCDLVIKSTLLLWTIIIAGSKRKKEYRADNFAYRLGYGKELLSALYKIYDMEISDKKKILDRMKQDHPKTAYRIEKIESYYN